MSRILHVLLTGGIGSRLWPLSRHSKPKQYLEIFSGSSLFELAIKRNQLHCTDLVIVGNKENKKLSKDILTKLKVFPLRNISEAVSKNTAPAIAFAALSSNPEDILLVTPADHIIEEGEEYDKAVEKAIELADKNYLVTFGIKPDKPETGFGYIEHVEDNVISFHEKPNKSKARQFIEKGSFLWNSGMFCFKAGSFLEELHKFHPEMLEKAQIAWSKSRNGDLEFSSSVKVPAESIDYAVMEKSERIKVVKSDFKWSDMGSFESVYEYLKNSGHSIDVNQNMQIGDNKPTFFVGVNNCILISTHDANLIVSKEASQEVKTVYQYLEKNNPELLQ